MLFSARSARDIQERIQWCFQKKTGMSALVYFRNSIFANRRECKGWKGFKKKEGSHSAGSVHLLRGLSKNAML